MGGIVWLLNYAATHPDATLHYCSSKIILRVAIHASYLCEERAHNWAGGHFFLANQIVENTLPTNNVAIHTQCQLINTIMYSAAEA